MAQQLRNHFSSNLRGGTRERDLSLASKFFSRELSQITDPSAVLALPSRELYDQVDFIISELIHSRGMNFSSNDRKVLTGRVVDSLLHMSAGSLN